MSKSSNRLYGTVYPKGNGPDPEHPLDDGVDHGYRVEFKSSELTAATMKMLGNLGIQLLHPNDHQAFAQKIREIENLDPTFPLEWMPDMELAARDHNVERWDRVLAKMFQAATLQKRPGAGFGVSKVTPRQELSDEGYERQNRRNTENARIKADHHVAEEAAGIIGKLGPCHAGRPCPWVTLAEELEAQFPQYAWKGMV